MNAKAVPQAVVKSISGRLALLASVAVVALLVGALGGTAVAAPIGKGGKVQACYRVKGKAKGAMRVVPTGKKCRKGERKLAWATVGSTAGPAGPVGPTGPRGSAGDAGATGATGPAGSSNEAALQAKIAGLTLKVEGLEGILQGVTNGQLTGTIDKLTGITGLQLNETVGALPVVDSLCTQAAAVPGQINAVGTALGGLTLGGLIPGGLVLTIPSLTAVTPFTCPS